MKQFKSKEYLELQMLVTRKEAVIFEEGKRNDFYITKYGDVYSHCRGTDNVIKRALYLHKKTGYLRITINNVPKEIHVLVAKHFVYNPNPKEFDTVDHISANYATTKEEAMKCRQNNDYRNLRWCTQSMNMKYAHENGLTERIKEARRLLTMEQAVEAREKFATGAYKKVELAEEYGVSHSVMSQLLNERTYIF